MAETRASRAKRLIAQAQRDVRDADLLATVDARQAASEAAAKVVAADLDAAKALELEAEPGLSDTDAMRKRQTYGASLLLAVNAAVAADHDDAADMTTSWGRCSTIDSADVADRGGAPATNLPARSLVGAAPPSWAEELRAEAEADMLDADLLATADARQAAAEAAAKVIAVDLDAAKALELKSEPNLSATDAAAAVLAYRVGLAIAVERAGLLCRAYPPPEVQVEVVEENAASAEDRFWAHPFVPALPGDVLGADVHHAAVAVAVVRRVQRVRHAVAPSVVRAGFACDGKPSTMSDEGPYTFEAAVTAEDGTAALVCNHSLHTLVVAVAAAQEVHDWVLDMQVQLTAPPDLLGLPTSVRVDAGWAATSAALIEKGLFDKIAIHARSQGLGPNAPPMRVVWAGHGLGAAIATLLAASAAFRSSVAGSSRAVRDPSKNRAVLVTFGSPRIGNAAAQALVGALTAHTRVMAEGDTVPRLPVGLVAAGSLQADVSGATAEQYFPAHADRHLLLRVPPVGPAASADCPGEVVKEVAMDVATQAEGESFSCETMFGLLARHNLDHYLASLSIHYDQLRHRAASSGHTGVEGELVAEGRVGLTPPAPASDAVGGAAGPPPCDAKTPTTTTTTTDVSHAAPPADAGGGTSNMPTIAVKRAVHPGVHYHRVRYGRDGSEKAEAGGQLSSDALAHALAAPDCPYTDVFFLSHGYNTDAWDPTVAIRSLGEAPAATNSAEGASAGAAVKRELAQLVGMMNEEDAAAVADRPALKGALSILADAAVHPPVEVAAAAAAVDAGAVARAQTVASVLPATLYQAYMGLATELAAVDKVAAVGDDDEDDDGPVVTIDPGDAFAEALQELTAEAATAAAKTAPPAASTVFAAAHAGATAPAVVSRGLGTSLVGAATTAAIAALLRRTAILTLFGRFQHRSRVVGRVGVRGLLAKLMTAAASTAGPAPKFHLAGDSLGSHVVSSALVGPRRGGVPLPAKVHSVVLVQGAVPAGAYGPGKTYGSLLGPDGPVAGPVVATHSTRDSALWFYIRAYGGEPLGLVGANHQLPVPPRRLVMGGMDAAYDFGAAAGQMVNVDASGLGGKLVGSHGGVADPSTTHLIWAAALADEGAPAESTTTR
ncbi:hypothetical protein I4F81_008480 [Pyropia yezoensis]|uniref:Uncharacterized protein n=1 Tax=Pyropia yezoensis TaxID=2788 RepID=A0ACC3C7M5_PYRYE|nr:hypothetical protein I4F81_008480 [Neopyropia yezoensis]